MYSLNNRSLILYPWICAWLSLHAIKVCMNNTYQWSNRHTGNCRNKVREHFQLVDEKSRMDRSSGSASGHWKWGVILQKQRGFLSPPPFMCVESRKMCNVKLCGCENTAPSCVATLFEMWSIELVSKCHINIRVLNVWLLSGLVTTPTASQVSKTRLFSKYLKMLKCAKSSCCGKFSPIWKSWLSSTVFISYGQRCEYWIVLSSQIQPFCFQFSSILS